MDRKITIYDVANHLGVSPTTVYKALNGKPKVSEETRELIIKTAEKLGYKANIAAKSLARRQIRIGMVVDASFPAFHDEVVRGAKAACEELADFNVKGEYFSFTGPNRSKKLLEQINALALQGYDGILISPGIDTRGYAEKINQIIQKGISCAAVVSDISDSSRVFCVRYDGRMGGKVAAQLMGWLGPGTEVAVFTGNSQVDIHKETVGGFLEEASKRELQVVGVFENQDDPDIAYYAVGKLLSDYPDVKGIYVNSANSAAVCKRIVELGLEGEIKIIASDIFVELAEYISQGVVAASVFQDPFRQGRLAFKKLYEHISGDRISREDQLIPPQIIIETNLNAFINL